MSEPSVDTSDDGKAQTAHHKHTGVRAASPQTLDHRISGSPQPSHLCVKSNALPFLFYHPIPSRRFSMGVWGGNIPAMHQGGNTHARNS